MSFEAALRATEILLALALVQQSIEHLALHRDERLLFLPRLALALSLLAGTGTAWVLIALCLCGVIIFKLTLAIIRRGNKLMW